LAGAEQAGIVPANMFTALDTLTRRLREQAGDNLEAINAQPSLLALTSTSLEAMTRLCDRASSTARQRDTRGGAAA